VLFHWYTGPEPLLKEIKDHAYFISINPTVTIQEKQRKIIEKASEEILLTESDGPYVYRSMRLDSTMILQTLEVISEIKKISIEEISQIISNNYERYMMKRMSLG
jgi:TatD DNase family protein